MKPRLPFQGIRVAAVDPGTKNLSFACIDYFGEILSSDGTTKVADFDIVDWQHVDLKTGTFMSFARDCGLERRRTTMEDRSRGSFQDWRNNLSEHMATEWSCLFELDRFGELPVFVVENQMDQAVRTTAGRGQHDMYTLANCMMSAVRVADVSVRGASHRKRASLLKASKYNVSKRKGSDRNHRKNASVVAISKLLRERKLKQASKFLDRVFDDVGHVHDMSDSMGMCLHEAKNRCL